MTARIKYARDSNNNVVHDVGNRANNPSIISKIEIISTVENIKMLESKVAKGVRFAILYKE